MTIIQANLRSVLAGLRAVETSPVTLVAVSKTKSSSDVLEAYNAGQRRFGENYVAEICEKAPKLPSDIEWHFIGHLQSNKVHKLITGCPNLFMIETIDSEKLASKVNSAMEAAHGGRSALLRVLIEVKTSSEATKTGVNPQDALGLMVYIKEECPRLIFSGLMTMADPLDAEGSFRQLSELASELRARGHAIETMSMGMSGDYEIAVRNGSTEVRIGSKIFGERTNL